eukprot:3126697-Prymnesium_polylepis.1
MTREKGWHHPTVSWLCKLVGHSPWTTRRHSLTRTSVATQALTDGSARFVDGTRRLPNSPRINTYLVPATAPQGARSA